MAHSLPLAHERQATPRRPELALSAKGFRPFFLLAGSFALVFVPCWLLVLFGIFQVDGYLDASSWHAHEMIFGYVTAVVAGFLLTAVANWTQRETLTGAPLIALAALWLAGRVAMICPQRLPFALPAVLDLALLPLLIAALARPLIATHNRRNYPLLAVLCVLFACNVLVHAQAIGLLPIGSARRACLFAVDVVLVIILLVIGRVLPMFTRNATQATQIRSNATLDNACLASMVVLAVTDAAWPQSLAASGAAGLTALLSTARAWHWGARHTLRQPLLWVLHAGYAWIVVGLSLRALAGLQLVPSSLATHALTVGAIGTLTLGMMSRVTLGHTGRMLVATPMMMLAFLAINLAAAARSLMPWLIPSLHLPSLWIAGCLWSLAFLLFVISYARVLSAPRIDGKLG